MNKRLYETYGDYLPFSWYTIKPQNTYKYEIGQTVYVIYANSIVEVSVYSVTINNYDEIYSVENDWADEISGEEFESEDLYVDPLKAIKAYKKLLKEQAND